MFSTQNDQTDLYAILGIEKDSNIDQIKKAYKQKARENHPDKNQTAEATAKFQAIQEAYEILSDVKKREEYDSQMADYFKSKVYQSTELSTTKPSLGFNNVEELVKNHKLDDIKRVIRLAKLEKDWRWQFGDDQKFLEAAMRDAILLGHKDIVEFFIKEGIHINGSAPLKGLSGGCYRYMYFAGSSGNLEMVKLLVENKAAIAPHDKGDDSGIRAAIKAGHVDIVRYLLEKGATSRGVFGAFRRDTFIAHAAKHDRLPIVDLLIRYGAGKSIQSSFGLAEEKYVERIRSYQRSLEGDYSEKAKADIVKELSKSSEWMRSYYEGRLKEFEEKKPKIEAKLAKYILTCEKIVRNIMDYAIGVDFSTWDEKKSGLEFLKSLKKNVADVNFLGVSVGGHPVTREMLSALNFEGVDKAIVSIQDLEKISDPIRREALRNRLNTVTEKQGKLIRNNIVNVVPLWRAAEIGDVEAVKIRLATGIDPNEVGEDLPIVLAVKNGHEEIVDLLRAHPKFDVKTLAAAIKTAQANNNIKLADKLTDTQDINQLDENGDALLHHAVRAGKVDEVKKLLGKGAEVNLKGKEGYPLYMAASKSYNKEWGSKPSKKHIEILKLLLAHHADPNLVNDWGDYTAMEAAGCAGSAESLAILLPITTKKDISYESGISGEKHQSPWYTRIMFKSFGSSEWIEILKLLKENGADFNQKDEYGSDTLLDLVMRTFPSLTSVASAMRGIAQSVSGCEDRIPKSMLSDTQRDLIQDSQRDFFKHIKLMDFLLENGADPRIVSGRHERTALHTLIGKIDLDHIMGGYARIIDKCLMKGFDINSVDAYGQTLLHIAAESGGFYAVKYLLARGASINVQDKAGRTPLHYAAGGGFSGIIPHAHPETTQLLLEHGADPNIKDKKELSPLQYSNAVREEWTKSESYKGWKYKVQKNWSKPFDQAVSKLRCITQSEKPKSLPEFTQQTKSYLDGFKSNPESNLLMLEGLPLEEKHKELFENYRDDVSHEIIKIPVVLNERVYDLKTLLTILEKDKKDPFTGQQFDLSDIQPAQAVANEIEMVVQFFNEKYSKALLNKGELESKAQLNNHTDPLNKLGLFSGSKPNTSQTQEKSIKIQKDDNNRCVLF